MHPTESPARHPKRWLIHAVLSLSLFVVVVDNTVLNVAIPSLSRDLGATTAEIQWIIDAYSLVFAGLLLIAGSLSDRYGRKRALLAGFALFGLGSLGAAFADDALQLTLLRGAMGVGGAFLMPGTLSILMQVFDRDEQPKAVSLWGMVAMLGVASGPTLGGLLIERFWWGSVFLINVPVIAVAFVAAVVLVPESRDPARRQPDVPGTVLSTLGVSALVWAIVSAPEHGWSSARTLGGLAVAVAALVAFVSWERRTPHAMLDLGLFRHRPFTGGSLVIVLMTFAIAGMTFSLTQYLQFVLGYTPLEAGLRTVPLALAGAVSNPVGLQLGRRIGQWAITIAFALMAVAFLIIAAIRPGDGYGHLLTGLIVMGLGGGMVGPTAYTAIMTALPKEQAGVGSAVNDAAQEVGNAFGVAVLGSVLSAAYASSLPDGVTGPARESIGAALAAAAARGGTAGEALAQAARDAFVDAMSVGFVVGAVCAVAAGVAAGALLRIRPTAADRVAGLDREPAGV